MREPRNLPLKRDFLGTTEHGVLGEHYGVFSLTSITQGLSSILTIITGMLYAKNFEKAIGSLIS